jgi:hypothetical protein
MSVVALHFHLVRDSKHQGSHVRWIIYRELVVYVELRYNLAWHGNIISGKAADSRKAGKRALLPGTTR